MRIRTAHLAPVGILIVTIGFYAATQPGLSIIRLVSKAFATSAVILLAASLAVGPLSRIWPRLMPNIAHRKYWGLTGFFFGLLHASLAFFDPLVFSAQLALSRPNVRLGLMALFVFALLAVTSNQWAQKKLGKHWKQIQQLGYVGLVFIGLDLAVLGDGTFIRTPLGLLLGFVVVSTLAIAGYGYVKPLKLRESR